MQRLLALMASLVPFRISLVRATEPRRRPYGAHRRSRRLRWVTPLASLVTVSVLGATSVVPVSASTSGTCTGTVNITPPPVRSITVAPSSFIFGACYDHANSSTGSNLSFPNGYCYINNSGAGLTITNGTASSHIDIQGADAVPSDAGTHWTLCTVGITSCTGAANEPGQDQFGERSDVGGQEGPWLSTSAQCDTAFDAPTSSCAATAGQVTTETLTLVGPSGSTDTSTQFSSVWTWTAAP